MAVFFKKAFKGERGAVWESVKVSDKTEIAVKMKAITEYMKMNDYIKKTYPDLSEQERLSLVGFITSPVHFMIENVVDAKMHELGENAIQVTLTEL